jgi:hypothetical protein
LLARICLLLLLSVYLVKTAPPYRLFSFIPLKHNQTRQFLTATFLFIPLFIDRFSQFKANKIWSEHLLDKAFLATRAEIANIRAAIDQMDESQTANYSLMADLYGIIALLAVCAIILF